jgi:flagellar hook-basal body complex protein FliE
MSSPIQGVGQVGPGSPMQRPFGGTVGTSLYGGQVGSFKDTLADALGDVQGLQEDAGDAVEAFLRGDPVELHDVMAAVEEAGLALEMLIEVRNGFIEAYRTVANMQS